MNCCLFFMQVVSSDHFITIKPWNKRRCQQVFFILLPLLCLRNKKFFVQTCVKTLKLFLQTWQITSQCENLISLFKKSDWTPWKKFLILIRESFKITINNSLRHRWSNQTTTTWTNKQFILKKWSIVQVFLSKKKVEEIVIRKNESKTKAAES